MKTLTFLFLFVSVACELQSISEGDNPLSLAFENVTSHLFRLETRMFIKNYGIDSETLTWLLLKRLNEKGMPFRLQNLEIDVKRFLHDSSAFLTFDSFEKLCEFNKKLFLTNDYYKPLQLFVYCQDASIEDITSLALSVERFTSASYFKIELSDIIQYEYFLVDDSQFINLMTFFWYSPAECGELQLMKVNKFNKLTKKWENDKFSSEKLKSFHNCEIEIVDRLFDYDNQRTETFLHPILLALSQTLNYRVKMIIPDGGNFADVNLQEGCYENTLDRMR